MTQAARCRRWMMQMDALVQGELVLVQGAIRKLDHENEGSDTQGSEHRTRSLDEQMLTTSISTYPIPCPRLPSYRPGWIDADCRPFMPFFTLRIADRLKNVMLV